MTKLCTCRLSFKSPTRQGKHVNSHPPDGVDLLVYQPLLNLNSLHINSLLYKPQYTWSQKWLRCI